MATAMPIKSLAPWMGSKRTMAKDIIHQLGPHLQYFDPFCGSLAVPLHKEPSRYETVNDIHADIYTLARVIQDATMAPKLYERLSRTLVSDMVLEDAQEALTEDYSPAARGNERVAREEMVNRAYWYFVASWLMRNGIAGTEDAEAIGKRWSLCVRYTPTGGSPTVRFTSAIESIPAWHHRLRNVVILWRDGFELIEKKIPDRSDTCIYVDPTYLVEGRSSARYTHEMKPEDAPRLAELLSRFKKTRVVVSYYDCDEVRDLYEGWTFIDKSRQKNLHAASGRGERRKEAPEVLIVNGEPY